MKEKLALIPLTLDSPEEPYKPSYSELMAELEADNKRAQIEKEKAKRSKKNQSFGSRLISWFWYLFVPAGFYFLLVDPVILILMIGFVIFTAYIKNLASKVVNGPSVEKFNLFCHFDRF